MDDDITTTAVVFPGQGSQRPGMAAAWRGDAAYARWAEADEILGRDVTTLGLDAAAEQLREPVNCQVALFVHHAVLFDSWTRHGGRPAVTAGHSLGEYNALVAAGALTFADGLRLVAERAQATQEAALRSPGGMLACLGCDPQAVQAACSSAGCHVANDNADGQIVVSGDERALSGFTAVMRDQGGRIVPLEVGAAYHSPLMEPALEVLAPLLEQTPFAAARVPVIANVDARRHDRADEWPALLQLQLIAPVRWRETMGTISDTGVGQIVELGAAPVLTGLFKRATPHLRRVAPTAPEQMAAAA